MLEASDPCKVAVMGLTLMDLDNSSPVVMPSVWRCQERLMSGPVA